MFELYVDKLSLILSELSDDDMDESDEEDDDDLEDAAAIREEKMRNLVPPLPAEEWGRKPSVTTAKTDDNASKKVSFADSKDNQDKPVKMRPPVFEPQEYDGVVDMSDDSDEDDEPARAGSLGRMLGDMKWADMGPKIEDIDDDDDEIDGLEAGVSRRTRNFGLGDDIDEAMKRKVWGGTDRPLEHDDEADPEEDMEFDPDMAAEQGDFLKFAQEALGISADQWDGIISSREARGG